MLLQRLGRAGSGKVTCMRISLVDYHERLAAPLAKIVGLTPEVTVMIP